MRQARIRMQNDSSFDSWRTRPRRRLLVLGVALGLLAYVAGETARLPLLTLGGLILFGAAALLVRVTTRGVADYPADALDERQIAVRDNSYLQAYRFLGGVVAVALLAVIAFAGPVVSRQVLLTALTATIFALVAAPSCVVAWTEKEA